jgi:CubicO group peptidase (beta-lactamase class C family)
VLKVIAAPLAFALCWFGALPASAQSQSATIEALVRQSMATNHLRSLIVQVRSNGSDVYTAAFGESMTGVPATPRMHFRNGAMAFTYMSTLLLELVDQKKVTLDTKLSQFRPDFTARRPHHAQKSRQHDVGLRGLRLSKRTAAGRSAESVPSMDARRAH